MPLADHLRFVAEPNGIRMRGAVRGLGFTLNVGGLGAGSNIISCAMADGSPAGFREVPLGRLLGYLESVPDGVGPSAASAMREMIGRPEAMNILDQWSTPEDLVRLPADALNPCWGRDELYLYAGESHRSFLARIVVTGLPNLVRVVPTLMQAHPGTFPGGRAEPLGIVLACLEVRYPWLAVDEDRLSRILALDWRFDSLDVICALLGIPWAWMPASAEERAAFTDIIHGTAMLAARLRSRSYLRPARGRWVDYARTVERRLPPGGTFVERLRGATEGACDMAGDFGNQVLLPIIVLSHPSSLVGILHGNRQSLIELSSRTLFGTKGLCAIVEVALEWHRAHGRTAEAIWKLGSATHHWPVPFGTIAAPNGLEISFLGNSEALRAEGAAEARDGTMGLDHCVAGYALSSASGDSAIASIRRRRLGVFRRYSTVEFRVDRFGTRVVQHKGRANGVPPRAAAHALDWFLGQVAEGNLVPDPAYLETAWRISKRKMRTVEDHCGYDYLVPANVTAAVRAWEAFLPRPLRSVEALMKADGIPAFMEGRHGEAVARRVVHERVLGEAGRPTRRWKLDVAAFARNAALTPARLIALPYEAGAFIGMLGHAALNPGSFSQVTANPALPVQVIADWPDLRPTRTRITGGVAAFAGGMAAEACVALAANAYLGLAGTGAFVAAAMVAVGEKAWCERAFWAHLVKDCRSAWHRRRIRADLDRRYGQAVRAGT